MEILTLRGGFAEVEGVPGGSFGPPTGRSAQGEFGPYRQSERGDLYAEALAEGYRLESLRAYDTLPQTPHVELIAKLART